MCHPVRRLATVLLITGAAWLALPASRVPGAPSLRAVAPIAEIRVPRWNAVVDEPVHIEITIGAPGGGRFDFRLEVEAADRPGEFTPLAGLEDVPASPPGTPPGRRLGATWDTQSVPSGLYIIRLRVTDASGALRETRVPVWVERAEAHEADAPDPYWDGSEELSALV